MLKTLLISGDCIVVIILVIANILILRWDNLRDNIQSNTVSINKEIDSQRNEEILNNYRLYTEIKEEPETQESAITIERDNSVVIKALTDKLNTTEDKIKKEESQLTNMLKNNRPIRKVSVQAVDLPVRIIYGQDPTYTDFIKSIYGQGYYDKDGIFLSFKDTNNILILGDSRVVGIGSSLGADKLNSFGVDVIGVGGAYLNNCINWLKALNPKKKYKNIIIFAACNDIRGFSYESDFHLHDSLINELNEVINISRKNVTPGNNIYIVMQDSISGKLERSNEYNLIASNFNKLLLYLKDNNVDVKVLLTDSNLEVPDDSTDGLHYSKLANERILNNISKIE